MSNCYSTIANYYDNFTHNDCDYVRWSQYLFGLAKNHNVKKVVDIACGTGKMTALLCKCGLQPLGVDVSAEMLSQAQQKCPKALFVRQDMTKLSLPSVVDMAVCVNDGANYLSPTKLAEFFTSVANNLKSGAPFVFDTSSPYKLREVVGNNVFYVDQAEATLLWANEQKGDTVKMSLTLFEKQGGSYLRSDETHLQYIHEVDFVSACLKNAGFELQAVTDDYGKQLTPTSLRITYYAVKI